VCGQPHDLEATTKRLSKIVAAADAGKRPSPGSDALPALLELLATREKELAQAQNALRSVVEAATERRLREEDVARRLMDLQIERDQSPSRRSKALAAATKDANAQILACSALREAGEALSVQQSQLSGQGRVAELAKEIEKLEGQVGAQADLIKDRSATGELAQRIVEALRSASSGVVVNRLAQISPLLQAMYSRIDPHPSFRTVGFLSKLANKRGRLNTVIMDSHSKIASEAPGTILSSSQMNALAVSVFMALNLGSRPPIDAALLDDPLQSLDDVNLLGLVDLLRRAKDHRQLLVSTHDERFGNLLARKLRPSGPDQRTVVIELGSWSREGPLVRRRDISGDVTAVRLSG
jgi:hypothetical protein